MLKPSAVGICSVLMAVLCTILPALAQDLPGHSHEADGEQAAVPQEASWTPFLVLEGRAQFLPAARRAAQAEDPVIRRRGLFILGALGLPEGVAPARQSLKHPDRLVRMQAAVALAMLRQPEGLPGAAVALREGPQWLQYYGLYGLWRLNSSRARQALRDSRPYLSGFLLETLDQALQASPKKHSLLPRAGQPDDKLSLYRLFDAVSGAYVRECDLWWHVGNYDQCIRAQQTALFFDPQYVDLYTNIAWLQWSMGRHGEAIQTYRQAIAANPRSWTAHQALGDYYWRHGHRRLGVTYLQKAADLGSPPVPRRALGHAYRQLGEAEQAQKVWQDILKLDPNDPIARRELERAGAR